MVTLLRRLLKYMAYTLFFILALIYFAPKVALFYLVEEKLNPYGVIISGEKLEDEGLCLNVKDAIVFAKGIDIANVSEMKIKIFGLYNNIELTNIKLSSATSAFVPRKINDLHISYSIFNPLNIKALANGDFGKIEASYNLSNFNLHIDLEASSLMKKDFKSTLRNLKKLETGVYIYDKTFKF